MLTDAEVGAFALYLSDDAPLWLDGAAVFSSCSCADASPTSVRWALRVSRDEQCHFTAYRLGNGYALGSLPVARHSLQLAAAWRLLAARARHVARRTARLLSKADAVCGAYRSRSPF